MKITILVENTVQTPDLQGEHGLSMLVETPEGPLLWDVGQSDLFLRNAAPLGVRPEEIRHIALSHGHYDHTGGLADILRIAPDAALHLHPGAFAARFAPGRDGAPPRSIGIPFGRDLLVRSCREILENREPAGILPGITLTGEIPRTSGFEDTGGKFFLDSGLTEPDPIADDQSLVLETARGLVLLLGCCHAGIVNTLRHVSGRWNTREFALIAGGMHLHSATAERMARTLDALRGYRIARLVPGHCTGWRAFCALADAFPEAVEPLRTGWTWEPK